MLREHHYRLFKAVVLLLFCAVLLFDYSISLVDGNGRESVTADFPRSIQVSIADGASGEQRSEGNGFVQPRGLSLLCKEDGTSSLECDALRVEGRLFKDYVEAFQAHYSLVSTDDNGLHRVVKLIRPSSKSMDELPARWMIVCSTVEDNDVFSEWIELRVNGVARVGCCEKDCSEEKNDYFENNGCEATWTYNEILDGFEIVVNCNGYQMSAQVRGWPGSN